MSFRLDDHREVWWIYAPERHPWGGLKIAHFHKSINGEWWVFISGETDTRRIGVRSWNDISQREGWVKVQPIPMPSKLEIDYAIDRALRDIATKLKIEFGGAP